MPEEFERYVQLGTSNKAVVKECWNGGRLLHWLPYQATVDPPERGDFFHFGSGTPLAIDAWRPSQPNGKGETQCVMSYLGKYHSSI